MCGEPCTTRREYSPRSTVDRSGYSPQVGIVMCHPTITAIHLPGSQCAGLAKVSDHAEQWFLSLGKVSDKCRPIIHFSIDVNGVLRIPGSKKLVIPYSLQIGGLSAWLRGGDQQVTAILHHQRNHIQVVPFGKSCQSPVGFQ